MATIHSKADSCQHELAKIEYDQSFRDHRMRTHLCGPSTGDWVDLLFPGLEPPVVELFSVGRPAGVVELDGLPALGTEEVAVAMG